MQKFDGEEPGGFYFSLPRLIAKIAGGNFHRTENNWLETNLVGAAVHVISYLFLASLLTATLGGGSRLVLLVCLVPAMLPFWMLLLYLNSLLIKCLRRFGLFGDSQNSVAQTVLVGIMTTAFAVQLMVKGGWTGFVGAAWLFGVIVNFIAAAALGFSIGHAKR